jgi:hypothetical protein
MDTVALGCRVHTGWAALVAVRVAGADIEILARRRIELLPKDGPSRFVYHQAAEAGMPAAVEMVERVVRLAAETTLASIRAAVDAVPGVTCCGVPGGSTKVPEDLAAILGSHSLIHAAEGRLYRDAVIAAARSCGLRVHAVLEKSLKPRAAELAALAKSAGPPWSEDQRIATAAALSALESPAEVGRASGTR